MVEAAEWQARCAARLREQWRRLGTEETLEAAADLWREERLRSMEPEDAAVTWLRAGVLAD